MNDTPDVVRNATPGLERLKSIAFGEIEPTTAAREETGGEANGPNTFPPFSQAQKNAEAVTGGLFPFSSGNWGEPDLSFAELPIISPDGLPDWLKNMAQEVAAATLTPVDMAVMIGFAVIATCLQGKFVVQGLKKQHIEELIIWAIVVLPPGNMKTAVFDFMTAPLRDWEHERNQATVQERARRDAEIEVAEGMIKRLKNDLASPDLKEEEKETKYLQLIEQQTIQKSPIPELRLVTNSGTMEGLRDIAIEQNGKVSILSEEGGLFDVISGLYNNGTANIDLLLKGYTRTPHTEERAKKTYRIPAPCITIGLCVQPVTLQALKPNQGHKTKGQLRGRGLLGRPQYCVPHSLVGHRDIEKVGEIKVGTAAAYRQAVRTLLQFLPDKTDDGRARPFVLKMTDEAAKEYTKFWRGIEQQHGASFEGKSEDRPLAPIQDWTTKLQGAVLRYAGQIHCAKTPGIEATKQGISVETMRTAVSNCTAMIPHAQEAFALMGDAEAPKDRQAAAVLKWLRDKEITSFKKSDIEKAVKTVSVSARDTDRILAVLERANVISKPVSVQTSGRPAEWRQVNPAIFPKK
jgi:hypothetical protein